jgi:glycosyltransferase involved in cell wall biosynthesis
MEEVAVRPAKELGLTNVTFTGYLGEKYLDTLASFDALLFLVPGSDGSCRAIREAMAMGRAVIGARRGMIPELVDDGTTGIVIDDTPENIARAIEQLAADRDRCRALGRTGRDKALRLYDVHRQALAVKQAYEQVLG